MNLIIIVFRPFVLSNSMSKLICNRYTFKLIIKTTAAYVHAQEQFIAAVLLCFSPLFCSS